MQAVNVELIQGDQ